MATMITALALPGLDPTHPHSFGISLYKSLVSGCLARTIAEHQINASDDPDGDAAFGTKIHAWLANYHFGHPLPEDFALAPIAPSKGFVSEADLAARYARRFSPEGLGIAAPLPPSLREGSMIERRLAMNITYADGRREAFAGTLDAPVLIDEATVRIIEGERKLQLTPGLYLVDHKTKSRKPPNLALQYLLDPQFTSYHGLWAAHGGEPLQGTLVNVLYRYKEDKEEGFQTFLIPPPDAEAIKVWHGLVRDAVDRLRILGPEWKDPTRCFEWNRACPLIDSCVRHNL